MVRGWLESGCKSSCKSGCKTSCKSGRRVVGGAHIKGVDGEYCAMACHCGIWNMVVTF